MLGAALLSSDFSRVLFPKDTRLGAASMNGIVGISIKSSISGILDIQPPFTVMVWPLVSFEILLFLLNK